MPGILPGMNMANMEYGVHHSAIQFATRDDAVVHYLSSNPFYFTNSAPYSILGPIFLFVRLAVSSLSGNQEYIIGKGYDDINEGYYFRFTDSTTLALGSYGGSDYGTTYNFSTDSRVLSGRLVNFAGLYDGSYWRMFIEGQEVSSAIQPAGALDTFARFAIGAFDWDLAFSRQLSDAYLDVAYLGTQGNVEIVQMLQENPYAFFQGVDDRLIGTYGFSGPTSVSVSESMFIVDSILGPLTAQADRSENISLSDSSSSAIGVVSDQSEALVLSDTSTGEIVILHTGDVSESISLSESFSAQYRLAAAVSESLALIQSSATTGVFNKSVSELMSLTHSQGSTTGTQPQTYNYGVVESMSLSESLTGSSSLIAQRSEAMSLSDIVGRASALTANASESMNLQDFTSEFQGFENELMEDGRIIKINKASRIITLTE